MPAYEVLKTRYLPIQPYSKTVPDLLNLTNLTDSLLGSEPLIQVLDESVPGDVKYKFGKLLVADSMADSNIALRVSVGVGLVAADEEAGEVGVSEEVPGTAIEVDVE